MTKVGQEGAIEVMKRKKPIANGLAHFPRRQPLIMPALRSVGCEKHPSGRWWP